MIYLSKVKELGFLLTEVNNHPLLYDQFVIGTRVNNVNSVSWPLFELHTDNLENNDNSPGPPAHNLYRIILVSISRREGDVYHIFF